MYTDIPMGDLEICLHRSKLNYARLGSTLNTLIHSGLLNEKDTVNVFIDLWDVVKSMYKPAIVDQIRNIDNYDSYMLISEIINIAGHYRHYFWSRLSKYTNIYFYYSNTESNYCKEVLPDFRNDFYNKRFRMDNDNDVHNNIISQTFSMVSKFCELVSHVYCINTGSVEYTAFPKMIIDSHVNTNEYNLIVAQSEVYYQCIGSRYDVGILHCKGERSSLVHLGNMYDILMSKSKNGYAGNISNELYPLVRAMSGMRELNVKSGDRTGVVKAVSRVQKMVDSSLLQREIDYDPETLSMLVDDSALIDRFKVISHKNIINHIKPDERVFITNQIVDRVDIPLLKEICNRYFKKNEVRLPHLFAGETI